MDHDNSERQPGFLKGGGEMGSRMRALDWSRTPLGDASHWPVPLQITLRTLLTTRHPMFLFWGPEHYCFYNDAYSESLGPEKHPSILGSPGRESWAEIWPIIGPQMEQVMAGGESTWHENQLIPIFRHGQLEEVYWTYSYGPVYDPDAPFKVGGVLVVCTETTQQMQAQQELRLADARWRNLFEQAPGFMCVLEGPEHRFTYANMRFRELVQRQIDVGDTVVDLFPDLRDQGFKELLDEVYRHGKAYVAEAAPIDLVINASGTTVRRYLDFIYQPIRDAANKVTGIFVEGADVTDRVNQERTIRISQERLNLAIEAAGLALIHVDLDKDKVIFSKEFRTLVDWGNDPEPDSNKLPDLFHEEDRERLRTLYQQAVQGSADTRIDTTARLMRRGGECCWIRLQSRTIVTSNGETRVPVEFIGTFTDITAERDVQEALHDARRQAEVANETKSAFLAHMSHEIRTPMSAVLGYADLLAMKIDDEEPAEYLQIIKRNGQFLLDIINDILDISKIESGKLDIQQIEFPLKEVIEDVQSMMAVRASDKGIDFKVDFQSAIPRVIRSDPQRLKQILVNLIGNAVKFTEKGSVQLLVRLVNDAKPQLHFSIVDTGTGMSREQLGRLFQPFSQGDESINRQFGGTGLGLAISQRLAAYLGGRIIVESTLGKGSCFSFSIDSHVSDDRVPAADHSPDQDQASADEPESIRQGSRVLVVEDHADLRHLIVQYLEDAGASVVTGDDGLQAIDRVERMIAGNEPLVDLVLLDMHMPRLDGYRCATRLRELGFDRPIVALTANVMPSDIARCMDSGCNAFLSKPIDVQSVIRTVAPYLQETTDSTLTNVATKSGSDSHCELQADNQESARTRVLVVDDAPDLTRLYQRLLNQKGFDTVTAENGTSALQLAEKAKPEIVLLDINLPDTSGLDLIKVMKAVPGLDKARYIALSGHSSSVDERSSLAAGFDHHLVKPVSLSELMDILRQYDTASA